MGLKKGIKRTHRRRAKRILTSKDKQAVRPHNRPRPRGKKIRVKH